LAAVALLLASGCDGRQPVTCRGCNVVLLLVDTLRADHLSSYGYDRQTTPFLDAFARSNVLFLNARSQSACTFPSVNSLLTSRHIFDFLDPSTRPGIPDDVPYLPALLRRHGYATAAVSASPIVRNTPSEHNLKGGFGRGFDHFDESCKWLYGNCVNRVAGQLLEGMGEPFFLYLHYMEPHDPYRAEASVFGRFVEGYEGRYPSVAKGDPNPLRQMLDDGREIDPSDLEYLISRYDEEILGVDAHLGAFLQQLEERGVAERTIVIVASDHGEAFLEHDLLKHCRGLYEPLTRVPLMMRIPAIDGPLVRRTWVENLDLVPTVLDYLGLPAEDFAGVSLRPLIETGTPPGKVARSSMGSWRSVNDDRFKLLWRLNTRDYLLFDLVADPAESRNLLRQERAALRHLRRELERWMAQTEAGVPESERARQAEEIEDELRALGYLN